MEMPRFHAFSANFEEKLMLQHHRIKSGLLPIIGLVFGRHRQYSKLDTHGDHLFRRASETPEFTMLDLAQKLAAMACGSRPPG